MDDDKFDEEDGRGAIEDDRPDQERVRERSKGPLVGILVFSVYILIAGATATPNVLTTIEFINALIAVSAVSIFVVLVRLFTAYTDYVSEEKCGGPGATNVLFALFICLYWGIATFIFTFNTESPIVSTGTGYFSAWATAFLAMFILAISLSNKTDEIDSSWFANSVLISITISCILVMVSAGVGCSLNAFSCENGRVVFAFVASGITLLIVLILWLILKGNLTCGSYADENIFVVLSTLLVTIWACTIAASTYEEPFALTLSTGAANAAVFSNGFFGVWFSFFGCATLVLTSHERFSVESRRSNILRRAIMFVLILTAFLVLISGALECGNGRCGPYEVYAAAAGALSMVALTAASYFYWRGNNPNEKYFAIFFVIFWIVTAGILTFTADILFSQTSSARFATLATAVIALGYLGQVVQVESANGYITRCIGGDNLDENQQLIRKQVYIAFSGLVVVLGSISVECINVCSDDLIFGFVVCGLSFVLLVAIYCLVENEPVQRNLVIAHLLLWVVALPVLTFVAPFEGTDTGNGFYATWFVTLISIWMFLSV